MFTEELNLIRESEANADALRKDARMEAKKIMEDAKAEAGKLLSDAESTAKNRYDQLIREGQQIAQEQYDQAIAAARGECAEMEEKAGVKESDVIQTIAERIVKSSVNH